MALMEELAKSMAETREHMNNLLESASLQRSPLIAEDLAVFGVSFEQDGERVQLNSIKRDIEAGNICDLLDQGDIKPS